MPAILFLAKDKPGARRALDYLAGDPAVDVAAVVTQSQPFAQFAHERGLPTLTHEECHTQAWDRVDLAVSYLYPKMIREPVISSPRLGCVNFHPAPLPKYRGVAPYSRAILEGESDYGVSAHFVDEEFDNGDLIEVKRFAIDRDTITALALEQQASDELFALFVRVVNAVKGGQPLARIPQKGSDFLYTAQKDLDVLREIHPSDTGDLISRKIRAFFHPPHGGAFVKLHGQEFTLLDEERLAEIASWLPQPAVDE